MIPAACKRLAEVDFPIAVVSKHAAREKSIRHGHPSTLHLWWARRPLASCRAMLLALLLPDPADMNCPGDFKAKARELLPSLTGKIGADEMDLRRALLRFIGDFANWDNSAHPEYLRVGRGLVKAAHPEETPLVVDPFAGGGSIPLEALRLGCDAFASDLNPVACLILKVMLEDIPRHGPGLAEELRCVGKEIKEKAEKELAEFYPKDPDGATPIAYLWARTVRCESPNCGAEIPLIPSLWLVKKPFKKLALKPKIMRPSEGIPRAEFELFEPKSENEVATGTMTRGKATCLCCGVVLPPDRVKLQLSAQRGGADVIFSNQHGDAEESTTQTGGARLIAVEYYCEDKPGRHYRLPYRADFENVKTAHRRLYELLYDWELAGKKGLCPVPDEVLPPIGTLGFRVQRYGMLQWGDLFTARQKIVLVILSKLIANVEKRDGRETNRELMAFAFDKFVRHYNSGARWNNIIESVEPAFGMQSLPITWTFPESIPWGKGAENFEGSIDLLVDVFKRSNFAFGRTGQVEMADASLLPLPDESVSAYFTDPPYYDAIPYSDLSDFFYVWLKRTTPSTSLFADPYDKTNPLTPKYFEAVQDKTRSFDGTPKDRAFFEQKIAASFLEGRRILKPDGICSIVFAHKTTEGWEALLTGIIKADLVIVCSWPIATEKASRLRARDSAALGASIHLVCRPRPEDASIGDWGDVLRELPKRVGDWMERLQGEGVRGADLVFACVGPALEIFSRYSKVVDANDREIPLGGDPTAVEPYGRGFLAYVWEAVGRTALEQVLGTAEAKARNSAAGALEEDARLTALFLWTLQATNGANDADGDAEGNGDEEDDEEKPKAKKKGYSLVYDVVRRFAQPLGIGLPKWEGRVIETNKGVVRLLSVSERARQLFGEEGVQTVADWLARDPTKDLQGVLFPDQLEERTVTLRPRGRGRVIVNEAGVEHHTGKEATTLDRIHAAMLLQAGGQANALRNMIRTEQQRGPDFLRLANALSALYPLKSEEKRLLDAMLLAAGR